MRIFYQEITFPVVVIRIVILCCGVLVAALFYSGLRQCAAGEQPSARLYSTAQAKRGAEFYKSQQCAQCHGADLGGVGPSPALKGDYFLSLYTDQSSLVLFDKIQKGMPQSNPGSLTMAQTADILAYILSVNKYADGNDELPSDRAKLKTIELPKPAK